MTSTAKKTYVVTLTETTDYSLRVEANNQKEAEEMAMMRWNDVGAECFNLMDSEISETRVDDFASLIAAREETNHAAIIAEFGR